MSKKPNFSLTNLRSLRKKRVPTFKVASRHPFAVPLITFAVLFMLSGIVYGAVHLTHRNKPRSDAKIVIISHDHKQQIVPSREATVGALLVKLNLTLNEGDVVEPARTAIINQDDFRINIYRAVPVKITDGANVTYTFSAAKTPRSIARQVNNSLFAEDFVSTEPADDFVRSGAVGLQVVVDRAVPVSINLYGTPITTRTHADTVAQLIAQKNIVVAKDDQVTPAADTPLTPNTQVFIVRNGTKIESVNEDIAMPIESSNDPSLAYGTNAVRQVGSAGKRTVTYQITTRNGVPTGRTVIQTVITQAPVTQIVVIGSSLSGIKGDMALAGISPSDYTYVDYIISHESGWCPTKAQGQYGGCPPYAGSVPSYGGYGLCQSTPGIKMASAGADWATNPVTQLRWCSGYAAGRYGSWGAAYNYWLSHHNW